MKRSFFAALLLCTLPFTASAYTTGKLYEWCSADMQTEQANAGLCIGYVAGVWQTASFIESLDRQLGICVPQEAKVGHIRDIFMQWAQQNPGKSEESASKVITLLLRQNFACR